VGVISGKGSGPAQFSAALRGITVDSSGRLYAVGDSEVKVFAKDGTLAHRWKTAKPGQCVAVDADGTVYVGEEGQIERFGAGGKALTPWRDSARMGLVTAIGTTKSDVLIADAQGKSVRRYDKEGKFLNDIGYGVGAKGFLIPNGVLDLSVDRGGFVHVTNPGKHRVERYTVEGEFVGKLGRFSGPSPEGFSGCCNPTNLTVMDDGRVVVTEKAGPRVKVYSADGKLLAIVADDAFDENCKNMDVAVDGEGRVYVVDTVRLHICVFSPDEKAAASRARDGAQRP